MLTFSKIRFKNLLSFGNMWTTIDFGDKSSILIQGSNGSGKSAAILDSLTFALYGRPFRKINKSGLVNYKNKKDMVVEVWFSNDRGDQFHIIRGMNPGTLEVYENDVLVNQDSKKDDYQTFIESSILKMDFQTFTQIVVLGKATYVAFLRLGQGDRRKFIESILNLTVLGTMNDITKAKMSETKNRLMVIRNSLHLLKSQIEMSESHIRDFEQESIKRQLEHESIIENQIVSLREEIETLESEISEKRAAMTVVDNDLEKINQKLDNCYEIQAKMRNKIAEVRKKIKFFSSNTICPTCENDIDDKMRETRIKQFNHKEQELAIAQEHLEQKTESILKCVKKIQKCIEKNKQIDTQVSLLEHAIQQKLNAIAQAERSKSIKISSGDDKIQEYRKELSELLEKREILNDERTASNSRQDCLEFILAMLKDNGIKTTIIKRHIPNIVSTMNHYLRSLGLFVRFDLNENFEESLLGRGIDTVAYNAYSEGEKLRIDLAMLLTWRDLAKRQNNLAVNFIIFDEILDSSADISGVESLIDIFKIMKNEGTKIFVVSHSDHWTDKFDKIWTIEKTGGFSTIKTQSS